MRALEHRLKQKIRWRMGHSCNCAPGSICWALVVYFFFIPRLGIELVCVDGYARGFIALLGRMLMFG